MDTAAVIPCDMKKDVHILSIQNLVTLLIRDVNVSASKFAICRPNDRPSHLRFANQDFSLFLLIVILDFNTRLLDLPLWLFCVLWNRVSLKRYEQFFFVVFQKDRNNSPIINQLKLHVYVLSFNLKFIDRCLISYNF